MRVKLHRLRVTENNSCTHSLLFSQLFWSLTLPGSCPHLLLYFRMKASLNHFNSVSVSHNNVKIPQTLTRVEEMTDNDRTHTCGFFSERLNRFAHSAIVKSTSDKITVLWILKRQVFSSKAPPLSCATSNKVWRVFILIWCGCSWPWITSLKERCADATWRFDPDAPNTHYPRRMETSSRVYVYRHSLCNSTPVLTHEVLL